MIYLDALVVKVRDGAHVRNKAAHIAVGVDMDGIKHVLGIWVQATEGAKFWAGVCAELANRGVRDVLIVCCDGLTGFPEAIEATWPQATVQTCVVHLIRAAMRFVNYKDRKAVAAALKPIYQAADADGRAGRARRVRRPPSWAASTRNTVATFEDAWERFTPFLAFPPELRRVIYTTNSIESLNYQLRKIIKNRGHFPNDDAVVKLLWLAICNIEDKRAREREPRNAASPPTNAKPPAASSKARSPPTGNKPSPNSPSPTPTASTPTSNDRPYTENLTGSSVQGIQAEIALADVDHPGRHRRRRIDVVQGGKTPPLGPGGRVQRIELVVVRPDVDHPRGHRR